MLVSYRNMVIIELIMIELNVIGGDVQNPTQVPYSRLPDHSYSSRASENFIELKLYLKRVVANQNGNISRVMHEQPVECAPARSKGPS